MNIEKGREGETSITYVEPRNIEILLELAKVGAKREEVSRLEH
jgi:hypothetical protein